MLEGGCGPSGSLCWSRVLARHVGREEPALELPIPDPVEGTQAGAVHEEFLREGGLVPWEEPHAGSGAECEASSSWGRRSSTDSSPHSPSRRREGGGGSQQRFRAGHEERSGGTAVGHFLAPPPCPAVSPWVTNAAGCQLGPSRPCPHGPPGPAALRAQPRRHHVGGGAAAARDRLWSLREPVPFRLLRARIRRSLRF